MWQSSFIALLGMFLPRMRIEMNSDDSLIRAQRISIFSPHQDDAELACGGTIGKRCAASRETHIIHLTDGRNSHLICFGIKQRPTPYEVKELRKIEVIEAEQILGNHPEALHFFDFEDGTLFFNKKAAIAKTTHFLNTFRPTVVLVPSRNDEHPDHIATYDIITRAIQMTKLHISIYMYFISSLRRSLQRPTPQLLSIDIRDTLQTKKAAISKFKTQITCFSEQQPRPVLTSDFLEDFYSGNEYFLLDSKVREPLLSAIIRTARSWLLSCKNYIMCGRSF